MTDISYVLYDTVVLGTVANTDNSLFQVTQGADATHTELFTNARGSGALPNQEKMVVEKISVIIDTVQTVIADLQKALSNTFVELKVQDFTWFKAPVQLLVDATSWGGTIQLAAAANQNPIGLLGDGYELKIPVLIAGGTPFKVRYFQGTALSAGSFNIKVCLHGTLTTGAS